jgi:catechol-2,3-dioxygenase
MSTVRARIRQDHHAQMRIGHVTDPDGNGIELYYDRPRQEWFDADGAPVLKLEYFDPVELVSTPTPQLGPTSPATPAR